MNRRTVDPTDPVSVAGDIHARISSYDSTAPVPTVDLLEDWAEMIYAANVEHVWLVEGVARVYMGGSGETPKNKLGAVISEARAARGRSSQGQVLAELGPAPSFDEDAPSDPGYAISGAYSANGAIHLGCEDVSTEVGVQRGCGAAPGDPCTTGERIRKIPCGARLTAAWRANSRKGQESYQQRRKHLAEHRRSFKPSWKNQH